MADRSGAPTPSITLEAVVDQAILKKFWQKMRQRMRKVRVYEFYLAHDPLEWLPFDYDLNAELQRLRMDVVSGRYRPHSIEIVRGGKSLGLSRPLAFFAPRDALLYRSIIGAAENDLLRLARPFARFGRSDSSGQDSESTHDSGWFRDWLRRQGHLWALTESHEWLVETDISNFFPSIHIQAAMRSSQ